MRFPNTRTLTVYRGPDSSSVYSSGVGYGYMAGERCTQGEGRGTMAPLAVHPWQYTWPHNTKPGPITLRLASITLRLASIRLASIRLVYRLVYRLVSDWSTDWCQTGVRLVSDWLCGTGLALWHRSGSVAPVCGTGLWHRSEVRGTGLRSVVPV